MFKGFLKLLVVPLGLEPRMTIPKTGVLPLHHGTISGANLLQSFKFTNIFLTFCLTFYF